MTHATKHTRRSAIPGALLAALLLAGCSTGHIGESWQCPLAEGGSCDSVAAADPAVPKADADGASALTEPLWLVRDGGRTDGAEPAPCAAGCGAGFDPFTWLARLFDAETAGENKTVAPGPVRLAPPEAPDPAVLPAAEGSPASGDPVRASGASASPSAGTRDTESPTDGPGPLPAETGADPAGDLRTGEVVARIWIAPFVDADGIYREASHVRVVLEPAGWRVE